MSDGKYRLQTSYSQIDKYLSCGMSWYLRYVESIKSTEKQKALEYGLATHESFEFFFEMRDLGIDLTEDGIKDDFISRFNVRDIPFDSEEEKEDNLKQGLIAMERLFRPVTEVEKLMVADTTEIIGIEKDFELIIRLPKPIEVAYTDKEGNEQIHESDEVYVIGFIDLVLRTPEGIVVVDHKSGKTKFDKDKLAHNLQFPLYCLAIYEIYGEYPIACFYNFSKIHLSQKVVIDEERMEQCKKECVKVFKKMGKPEKSKHACKPSFLCYWCDYSKHKMDICEKSSDFKPKSAK